MEIRANALAVLAKAPVAGRVKTRLLPALSAEDAAELARSLLVDQLRHLEKLDFADRYLAFEPDEERGLMEALAPPGFQLFSQEGDDLGSRMETVFSRLFAFGHERVVLIGGDLPVLPLGFFAEAYAFLRSSNRRVVLGPSRDGGYYLVGCNQQTPEIFRNMKWSHHQVLAETRERLTAMKVDSHLLPVWFDIDTPEDLEYLGSTSDRALANAMPLSQRLLRRLEMAKAGGRLD
jgi:rSAM/selenodomain-associated transferase 1